MHRFPGAPPTDPYVRNYLIRFLGSDLSETKQVSSRLAHNLAALPLFSEVPLIWFVIPKYLPSFPPEKRYARLLLPCSGSLGLRFPTLPVRPPDHRYYDPLRLPNVHLGLVRSSLSSPDTLYRPSLRLCLRVERTRCRAGLSSTAPGFRFRWISLYLHFTQGNIWVSQVPDLPP